MIKEKDLRSVLDSELDNCFGSLRKVKERLVKSFIKAGLVEEEPKHEYGVVFNVEREKFYVLEYLKFIKHHNTEKFVIIETGIKDYQRALAKVEKYNEVKGVYDDN